MLWLSFAFFICAVLGSRIHPDTPIFSYLSSFKVKHGSGEIVIPRSPPGLKKPRNPCGIRLYEIYRRLLTLKTAKDCQVISLHILFEFVKRRFIEDSLPLESTCSGDVEKALGSFARVLNKFDPAAKKDEVQLLKHCDALHESAIELLPFATDGLFMGFQMIEEMDDAKEVLKLIFTGEVFLHGIAMFTLYSDTILYYGLINKIADLPYNCPHNDYKCRAYSHLFMSAAYQFIINRGYKVKDESKGMIPVVKKLLEFAENASNFIQTKDGKRTGAFDWTLNFVNSVRLQTFTEHKKFGKMPSFTIPNTFEIHRANVFC